MLRRLIDSNKVMGFFFTFLVVAAIVALSYHPAADKAPKASMEPSLSGLPNPAYDGSEHSHKPPRGTSDPAFIPGLSDGPVNSGDPLEGYYLPADACQANGCHNGIWLQEKPLPKCTAASVTKGLCNTPNFGPEQQPVQDNDPALLGSTDGYTSGSAEHYAHPPTDQVDLPEWKCYKPSKHGGYVVPDGFRAPAPQAVGPHESLEQFPDWLCEMSEAR